MQKSAQYISHTLRSLRVLSTPFASKHRKNGIAEIKNFFHGKRRDDGMKFVRKRIKESGDWGVRNFAETPHIDVQNGQSYPNSM